MTKTYARRVSATLILGLGAALALTDSVHAQSAAEGSSAKTTVQDAAPRSKAGIPFDGAKLGQWTMDFEAAQKLAAEKGIPMLLNFTGMDWCPYCKTMDKDVFSKDTWTEYATERVVMVTLDFPRGQKGALPDAISDRNDALQERYAVEGFPTFVMLESDGETELGRTGAGGEPTPMSFIASVADILGSSEAGIQRITADLNAADAERYRAAVSEKRTANKEMKDWLATRPRRNAENTKKFATFGERIEAAEATSNTLVLQSALRRLGGDATDQHTAKLDRASSYMKQVEALSEAVAEAEFWLSAWAPDDSEENRAQLSRIMKDLESRMNAINTL